MDLGDGTQNHPMPREVPAMETAAAFYLAVYNVCMTQGARHVSHTISLNITTTKLSLLHVLLMRKLKVGQIKVTC